jgi:hypothetical protein
MRLASRIRRVFPEPQDSSFPGFTHLDEAAFASGSLKRLKSLHGSFFPCLFAPDLLDLLFPYFAGSSGVKYLNFVAHFRSR